MQKASILMPLSPGMRVNDKVVKGAINQTIDDIELLVLDQRPEAERTDIAIFSSNPRIIYIAKTFRKDAGL
jgi:hypothetical protein